MSGLENVISEIGKLPPMPQAVQRLAGLLQDPRVSAARLVELVQLDQALTANVLRVCNSAYFGSRRQISSLQQALTLIGNDRLLDIVMSQGMATFFGRSSEGYNLARGELWRHSVGAALGSQLLARRLGGRGDPMLYTAALLHDVGKVVLSEFVAGNLVEIRALVRERCCCFAEAERAVLGIDHAELGARMCELWDFPPQLVAGIRHHHHPENENRLSALVCVSDLICLFMGIGAGADGLAYHGGDSLMARLGLTEHDIHLVMVELADEMQRADTMLKI
jgi:putative nucleotidyltransferase with HDIG domain